MISIQTNFRIKFYLLQLLMTGNRADIMANVECARMNRIYELMCVRIKETDGKFGQGNQEW